LFTNSQNIELIEEYTMIANSYGIVLTNAQILEIGVGQRPYLGITFIGRGYDYHGIDLDQPIYPPTLSKFVATWKSNGFLRFLKTIIRFYAFDRQEYTILLKSLGITQEAVKQQAPFIQGDAGSVDLSKLLGEYTNRPLVVISESVFEHIPQPTLESILKNLRHLASPEGRKVLILTRPTIFTGITGSHVTEWYHHRVNSKTPKRSEPWEHLRRKRFTADTYLNKLTRADFRFLFRSCGFEIARETEQKPGLGAEFLDDPTTREELADWPQEELLSNNVMFELIPA
jgi:hypothetical protein